MPADGFAVGAACWQVAVLNQLIDAETDRRQVYILDDNIGVVEEAYDAGFSPLQTRVPRRPAAHEGIPRYWSIEESGP